MTSNTAPLALKAFGRREHSLRDGTICQCCTSLIDSKGRSRAIARRRMRRIEDRNLRTDIKNGNV